jgi:hypothetical protein
VNDTLLIITGIAAVVALAAIAAIRSVLRKNIGQGGTFAWSLWTFKWSAPQAPVPVTFTPPHAEEPAVSAATWRTERPA